MSDPGIRTGLLRRLPSSRIRMQRAFSSEVDCYRLRQYPLSLSPANGSNPIDQIDRRGYGATVRGSSDSAGSVAQDSTMAVR